jgi:hypothetical protein
MLEPDLHHILVVDLCGFPIIGEYKIKKKEKKRRSKFVPRCFVLQGLCEQYFCWTSRPFLDMLQSSCQHNPRRKLSYVSQNSTDFLFPSTPTPFFFLLFNSSVKKNTKWKRKGINEEEDLTMYFLPPESNKPKN